MLDRAIHKDRREESPDVSGTWGLKSLTRPLDGPGLGDRSTRAGRSAGQEGAGEELRAARGRAGRRVPPGARLVRPGAGLAVGRLERRAAAQCAEWRTPGILAPAAAATTQAG